MLLFCQVVPSLLLTTCWQVVGTTCNKAVEFIKLVASLLQACSNLSTSWEQAVRINLATSLFQQACNKPAAGWLQVVRFSVCTLSGMFEQCPRYSQSLLMRSHILKAKPRYWLYFIQNDLSKQGSQLSFVRQQKSGKSKGGISSWN